MGKKSIILLDCEKDDIEDFFQGLIKNSDKWEIKTLISNQGRTSIFSNLKRYVKYFTLPFTIFLNRNKYGDIIGWQQYYALIFCFYCAVFRVKKVNTVVALNFTYKKKNGVKGKIYKKFMDFMVKSKYLDYIHVPSDKYAKCFSEEFGFDYNKIVVVPFGIKDIYDKWKYSTIPNEYAIESGEYALAIGRSNRDYEWLIEAWDGICVPLVIICDEIHGTDLTLLANVIILKNVSGDKQFPFFANCKMMILPLKDGNIASGDTVALTAMSFEKNVIVTKPSTIAETYIKHGINGFSINKKKIELKNVVNSIISGHDIGKAARKSYIDSYSLFAMGINIRLALGLDEEKGK